MSTGAIAYLPRFAAAPLLMMSIFGRGKHDAARGSAGGCGHGHGHEHEGAEPSVEPTAQKRERPEDEPDEHGSHGSVDDGRTTSATKERGC